MTNTAMKTVFTFSNTPMQYSETFCENFAGKHRSLVHVRIFKNRRVEYPHSMLWPYQKASNEACLVKSLHSMRTCVSFFVQFDFVRIFLL